MTHKDPQTKVEGVPGVYLRLGGEEPVERKRRSPLVRLGAFGFTALAVAAGGLMAGPDDAWAQDDDDLDDASVPSAPSELSVASEPSAASLPSVASVSAASVSTASMASTTTPSTPTTASTASLDSLPSAPSAPSTPSVSEVAGVAGLAVTPSDAVMDEDSPNNLAGTQGA